MASNKHKSTTVLGESAYKAIAAVEGLEMSRDGKKRRDAAKAANMSPDERRKQVLRAYQGK